MRKQHSALGISAALPLILALNAAMPLASFAQAVNLGVNPNAAPTNIPKPDDSRIPELGTVTVTGGRPSSLPTQIPTAFEGISREQLREAINATDSSDALKYLPSLNVRKRYIGDFDHAVLASRASGTGNSARSLVYADGILLSNLLGNGATYTPRWGLVSPEEIERVDVMYGPFSAAYSGNSVGAVVDYITRMPTKFEAHAKVGFNRQSNSIYGLSDSYSGNQSSASLGNRSGDFAWWLSLSRTRSNGQPIVFANKLVSSGTAGSAGRPVTGAITENNPRNQPWLILGATNINTTTQEQAKIKLAYDFSSTLRASYTLGWWHNETSRDAQSFLRDAAGNAIYSGTINFNNRSYALNAADFGLRREELEHVMHGFSLKSNTRGNFDWELAASTYRYSKDEARANTPALPAAATGGAGTITDGQGTGWKTFAAKGTWRPQGIQGEHIVDFGLQQDSFNLSQQRFATPDWIHGSAGARNALSQGRTELTSAYAQDYWRLAKDWRLTSGLRAENWKASDGATAAAAAPTALAGRSESALSPKLALAYQAAPDWALKASLGRAVRWPTVAELYQSTGALGTVINNDPNLRPEKSWTSELTAERDLSQGMGTWRNTLFFERTRDALYSQLNIATNVTNVQNVGRIATSGFETAYTRSNVGIKGLDLSASLTYTRSIIKENAALPASVDKWQPRVPNWRATLLATYKPDDKWSYTVGTRYSGRQYSQLDNSDTNENAYQSVSRYFVADVRVNYRFNKQWSAALGIDNLNNATYWAFHPYPQRTLHAELKFDL